MNDERLLRYSRHILLDGFDIAGQERLIQARVLIVGAGGLGCAAAMYLAASGVGTLIIADDDVVDISNLQRQIGHSTADIGRAKVNSLADRLRALNPNVNVVPLHARLLGSALRETVGSVDTVLDCSDNFMTRHAINRACVAQQKPLVSGAAIRFEGQVVVFNQAADSPCYACLYGEQPEEDDTLSCSELGVLAPLVGVVGSLQTAEALRLLVGFGKKESKKDCCLHVIDLRCMEWRSITLKKDPQCTVCASTITEALTHHV